jgi:capsular exopolysaccharide synthesis family protein
MIDHEQHKPLGDEEELDLGQYLAVLRYRKWSILSLATLVTLVVTLIVYSITPVYKSAATLLIEPEQQELPTVEEVFRLRSSAEDYYKTQVEVLKSRRLAELVVIKLKLDTHQGFMSKKKKKAVGFVTSIKVWLSLEEKKEKPRKKTRERTSKEKERDVNKAISKVRSGRSIKLVKDSQLIKLTFESEISELTAEIANGLADVYIEDQLAARVAKTRQATAWMEQRLKVLKKSLETSDEALQAYKERFGLIDVQGVSTLTEKEVEKLTAQFVTARSKYTELSKRYGSKHPKLVAARSELQTAETLLAKSKSKIQTIGRKTVKLRELKRQVDSDRQLYDTFLTRLKEASQAIDIQTVNARISDYAVVPRSPFKPDRDKIIMLAFFASIMLGIMLAFLYEALDRTFKSTTDIENKLGLPILGLLPLTRESKHEESYAITMLNPAHHTFAEAVLTIRTGLVLSSLDNPHKVILVTSSVPGEGKSTVAVNLAVAMGKMEKALLIGADLRRPALTRSLGLNDSESGLSDVIAGTADFKSCVHHFENLGIDVMPCGAIPPNPLELLSSERFAKMLEILEKHYDRIVIDSPPVQAVSDALVMSRYAKAVVYVVAADSTHQKMAQNGVKRLLQHDAPIAGIVLNKFNVERSVKYGYEDGGYYDHYGYAEDHEKHQHRKKTALESA